MVVVFLNLFFTEEMSFVHTAYFCDCYRYNRILVTSESFLGFMGQNIKIQAFKAVELFIKSNQCMFADTWWVQALMKNSKAMKKLQ